MRKKIVAGNWKMNTTVAEGEQLVNQIKELLNDSKIEAELVVAPPFTHLVSISELIKGTKIALSSQNCADEVSGAYTGEVSAKMIKSTGCEYVILGHSERREYYGENGPKLLKKVNLALSEGIKPIFCIGEKLEEREAGKHFQVVEEQIKEVLFNLSADDFAKVVVAYEPVWAIGTGKTATSEQAQEIHAFIREVLAAKFGKLAAETPILYGGSCKPSNAAEIFARPDVDGGLIGGASLVAADFIAIAKAF
jgi:triosephosphate isomerase